MSTEVDEESIPGWKSIATTINLVESQYTYKCEEYKQYWRNLRCAIPKLVELDGYYLLPGFEFDTAQYAYDKLELSEGDVIVANYPKTGTTWLTEIIRKLFSRKDEQLEGKYASLHYMFTFLEFGPVCKYVVSENLPFKRKIFATHLPPSLLNLKKYRENGVKVIYVIRNPKDQAVSWCKFAKQLPAAKSASWRHIYPQDEKLFYDIYIAGKQLVFSKEGEGYLEHVRAWYKHKNDPNLLWLVYEDLKKRPKQEILKLAEFLGESPAGDELDWILKKTSFSSMNKRAEVTAKKFFRKGEIGDWRNHLSDEQSETIDRKVDVILGDTDIKFTYK